MADRRKLLPILEWQRTYSRRLLAEDMLAAVVVTIMLIPQSLAYALLAGLPPQVGLYASMLPLLAYALLGTSRTLAVGPVAVVSLMTASAIGEVSEGSGTDPVVTALVLALLSGGILIFMGFCRLGFIANFLSHPVISGFITAAGILIAASQFRTILGLPGNGDTFPKMMLELIGQREATNYITLTIGGATLAFLYLSRTSFRTILRKTTLTERIVDLTVRTTPIIAVAIGIALSLALDLGAKGVALIGIIPQGLPSLGAPPIPIGLVKDLALPAFLISMVGFVESVSVAQTLAARRRERIDPDQELIALGAANIASGVSSGYPVTGGLARSVVNFEAGAQTPAAGAFTAIGIALTALYLTPFLAGLPQATLSATIIVAILSLVDIKAIRRVFLYSKSDFAAMLLTIVATLSFGVEPGIVAGVALSLALHLYRTSKPHTAIVGQVPGTEHFRNVERHNVITRPEILSIRVDESLYFANSRYLEDCVAERVSSRSEVKHVILMCSAVNEIDASALESLEEINRRLADAGITFHLSEVKGPVMDRLRRTGILDHLSGSVFLSQYEAIQALRGSN